MKKWNLFLMGMAVATIVTACSEDNEVNINNHPQLMNVNVNVEGATITRAINKSEKINDGESIGIFVKNEAGADYDGLSYNNISYQSDTPEGSTTQVWNNTSGKNVLLSSTSGKALAYYPYAESIDYKAIPVETATQTDYMSSKGWVAGLSNSKPSVSFTMEHALSAIGVVVLKSDYTGAGKVTEIKVSSEAFGTTATLDAETGKLSDVKNTSTAISRTVDFTIDTEGINTDILVAPNELTGKTVTITLTIDGKSYTTTSEALTGAFLQGTIYSYTLTLKGTDLSVSAVSVKGWETKEQGGMNVEPV